MTADQFHAIAIMCAVAGVMLVGFLASCVVARIGGRR